MSFQENHKITQWNGLHKQFLTWFSASTWMLLRVPNEADVSSRQGRLFALLSQTLIVPCVSEANILLNSLANWEKHSDRKKKSQNKNHYQVLFSTRTQVSAAGSIIDESYQTVYKPSSCQSHFCQTGYWSRENTR